MRRWPARVRVFVGVPGPELAVEYRDQYLGPIEPLTASDFCDRCPTRPGVFGLRAVGIRAYVAVLLRDSGRRLLFCAHHYAEHEEALKPLAGYVRDDRHFLVKVLDEIRFTPAKKPSARGSESVS
jgi:hypothetical protein